MSRFNNFLKFFMINVNILFAFVGVCLFGLSMYVWCSNWGNLEHGFFIGSGAVVFLFGVVLFIVGCLGCMAVDNQNKKFKSGLTGRKIIFIHLLCMILGLIGELVLLRTSLNATKRYHDVYVEMKANPNLLPPYEAYETFIDRQFNRFFFGAASECSSKYHEHVPN